MIQYKHCPINIIFNTWGLLILFMMLIAPMASAADAENCLMCHRYRGLSRVDKNGNQRLFYVDETLFSRGPHKRVTCKGCHSDINKIPHDDAKPVDCLQSCHIEEPTREILFTHAGVEKSLKNSVHSPTDANHMPREHPEDFPQCKDCHDSPLFRPVSIHKQVHAGVSEKAIHRCTQCHSEEKFVRYFYSHVTTRLHKARDPREVVAMCGSCHADPAFTRRHGLSNVVESYMETYHGKAVAFGSTLAPDCLDCHASQDTVHKMLAASDPLSSVSPENKASTCTTQDCHVNATPALASFDVHATKNPKTDPMEFGVALFFVLLTLGVLLPILTLNVLGLIRELFPSRQAKQELKCLTKLAEKKAALEGGIHRFNLGQRLQHIYLVVVFTTLSLTGLPMKFPEAAWAPYLYELFGGIHLAPIIHRIAGVGLLIGFCFHVLTILVKVGCALKPNERYSLKAWILAIVTLPMIPNWRDLKDLIASAMYVLYLSPKRPKDAWFCWKEKLEYFGVFWGTALLGAAGILLWAESWSSHVLPGWVLNIAYLVHTDESVLAVAYISLIHIPRALGRPGLSHVPAMVLNGKISPRVLAEEHGEELTGFSTTQEATS